VNKRYSQIRHQLCIQLKPNTTNVAVKDTLSKAKDMTIKTKDLTLEAKVNNMMYEAKCKALQNLYLGHTASNQYKIAQKAMSLSLVTNMLIGYCT